MVAWYVKDLRVLIVRCRCYVGISLSFVVWMSLDEMFGALGGESGPPGGLLGGSI